MSEKKDFLSELAREVSDQKAGKRDHIDTVDDWQPAKENAAYKDAPDEYESQPAEKKQPASEEIEKKQEPARANDNIYEDNSGRPGSFEEEKFTKVVKPKKHVSPMGKVIFIAAAAAAAFAIYWFGFAPHIELPDFTGKNISEVSTWARQNQMASSAIATSEPVYSMDYDADVVISQSVAGGTKVKKTTPITFTVSAGPDPDEVIAFPDIKSMTKDEIQSWISENKLSKAKISTEYSDTVAADQVISYEVKNGDEDSFTRNTTLNVKVSKGAAPEGTIAVTDYTNKTLADAQSFATKNGLNLVQQESFSDTVLQGNIISQSPASGQTLKKGDAFTIVISKGKGVKIPNLVGYTAEQLEAWQKSEGGSSIALVTSTVYDSAAPGSVIAQDVVPGTMLGSGDVLMITTSLYLPIMEKTSTEWLGKDWMELKSWVDDANWKGADIQAGQYNEYQYNECSDDYPTPGQIIDYACYYGNTDEANGCGRPLNIGSRIAYKVSTGPCTVKPATAVLTQNDLAGLSAIQSWCSTNTMSCTYEANSNVFNVAVEWNGSWLDSTQNFQQNVPKGSYLKVYYNTDLSTPAPAAPAKPDVVLTGDNLKDLSSIVDWCNSNSMSCSYTPAADEAADAVVISYGSGSSAASQKTGETFSLLVPAGTKIKVTYNQSKGAAAKQADSNTETGAAS